jgi:outer membrane protein TolC
VQAAEQDVAAARAARDAAAADARAVLGSALERYKSARERLTLFGQALLRGVREERESALAAYRAGELSLVELLDFERALARAEITRLESGIEAAEAYAELLMNVTDPEETR